MTIGMILAAIVYLEERFDTFNPDIDRIYRLTEIFDKENDYREYHNTPGGIAPGMKNYVPQVEIATRFATRFYYCDIKLEDGRRISTDGLSFADTCLFDVFQRPIITGDPHEVLDVDWKCMIPRSLAEKIGEDVIGQKFKPANITADYYFEIGGIYEDFPINSSVNNNIYVAIPTIRHITYDGRENWLGNDSYESYVKLAENTKVEELRPHIRKMLETNIDKDILQTTNFNIGVRPLKGYYLSLPGVKTKNMVLFLLAFIVLAISSFNYLLVTISQMQSRYKEMAVRKCFGTSHIKIFAIIMGESVFCLLLSLGISAIIIMALQSEAEQFLGVPPIELISTGKVWVMETAICLFVLVLTGVIPAYMYCRTSVSQAFRNNTKSRKGWKLGLLGIQFFASGLLFCLLSIVVRQYDLMHNFNVGFEFENVGFLDMTSLTNAERVKLLTEIRKLSNVERASTAHHDFGRSGSGNEVWLNNDWLNRANVTDFYSANHDIFNVLGIKFVQGTTFSETTDVNSNQVIVEKRFIDLMRKYFGVTDNNIVGKTFKISDHEQENGSHEYQIIGVIDNMYRGEFTEQSENDRPMVIFPAVPPQRFLYVKFHELNASSLRKAQEVIDNIVPDARITMISYEKSVREPSSQVRHYAILIFVISIISLMIAFVGLMGYITNEVLCRSKEIAIRKVNGMSVKSILQLFCTGILKVALPSLLLGCLCAVIVGKEWISQFTKQASLSPLLMLAVIVIILILIMAVVVLSCLAVVRANPINYLRNE